MLKKVEQFVKEAFEKSATGKSIAHFENTVYWIRQLRPDADEPIIIAAFAHDIARAFRKTNTEQTFKTKEFNDPAILEEHQKEGAIIISRFLKKEGYEQEKIERIKNMIGKHEVGGDAESNLIKDADSLSYFETNAIKHVGLAKTLGTEKVRKKMAWMFERISSPKAKEIAKPFYEKTRARLKNIY
ncbi:MAG: hypothetical protein CL943_01950 [Candidatus Diapherotrites archaeon]|uniref:HD domain-containing protein n=1 Tax=Candidatus Iainarchaeum sp. TaxID=3101447 RepID=A0A2D6M0U6_9ARCH|nr:hypothetical protein [Candidatus Diapherotrites archaeon]|tara:strand:- start:244 stop:801 length:558 start_codon:yes stop_codon:yes gene_type:complete